MVCLLVFSVGAKDFSKPLDFGGYDKILDPTFYDKIGGYLEENDKSSVIDSSMQDFKSIPVLSGKIFNGVDTIDIDSCNCPGILFSEKKASEYVFLKSQNNRLKLEMDIYKTLIKKYYDYMIAQDSLYTKKIKILTEEKRRSWLERNSPYLGFVAGILTVILIEQL